LRPARLDRVAIEALEPDVEGSQRPVVVLDVDDRAGREEVQPADGGDKVLAAVGLEVRPVVVGVEREADVLRRVVAVPQDPRRVVRGTALVTELELLETEDRVAGLGQVVRRTAAEAAEADDDVLELLAHARTSTASPSDRVARG
jgi:hypothetical protein